MKVGVVAQVSRFAPRGVLLGDGCVVRVGVRARGASVRVVTRGRFVGARTPVGACRCGAVRSRPSAVRSRRAVHGAESTAFCALFLFLKVLPLSTFAKVGGALLGAEKNFHSVSPSVLRSKVLPLSTFAKVGGAMLGV